MSNQDFYQILGVPKSVSQDEIKKAYRKLAHQYHPDKQGGDEKKFKELNEAYQTLSDPKKRQQYDTFGNVPPGGFGSQGFGGGFGFDGFDFSRGFGGEFNFEDIFDLFGAFGGRDRRPREESARGSDVQINLTISFYDAARGIIKQIELNKDIVCEECRGSGAKRSSEMVECPVCRGKGEIRELARSFFGNFARVRVCDNCRGTGRVPREKCSICRGEGKRKSKKISEIAVPAGINNGETLVMRGGGQAGFRGEKSGDLYITIGVENDKRFKRIGSDIVYTMPVKLTDALLGARVRVPTLDGEREIEIPAGAHEGDELRLKGFGVHGPRKGDQVIKIRIDMPKKLSGKAKRLVEELSQEI